MPRIYQLDAHVADLIAAGEVVERPSSVVKELTENAIDAGASSVVVEIQHGGMTYIRVTDNGCGIEPEDCLVAFLRHATSKIRTEYDLEAIGTLGFRGEALAAISSVSRIELMTRTADNKAGTSLQLEGGTVLAREEIGCPVGTTMIVRDLFFNTPARQKFLKKDSAEGAAVFAVVQHAAMSHPEVSFRFIRDGREDLNTPGDGSLQSALYSVLGRDIALGFIPCKMGGEEISVEGFVSQPVCCRGSRSAQFFFVNGRYVKSRTMQAALEQAYQNRKMVGKFPGCVLHIGTKLSGVDVNVHPTKTEVKFTSEKKLFDAVYYAVMAALDADSEKPQGTLETTRPRVKATDTVTPNQTFIADMTADPREEKRKTPIIEREQEKLPVRETEPVISVPYTPPFPVKKKLEDGAAAVPVRTPLKQPPRPPVTCTAIPVEEPKQEVPPAEESQGKVPDVLPEETEAKLDSDAGPEKATTPDTPVWRMVGEILNTYIIVEQGEEIFFIDKHAAHERMNFDRLKAQHNKPMSQILLAPLVLRLQPEETAAVLEHLDILNEFGFAAEDFGGGSIIVREAPDYLPTGEIEPTMAEIASKLVLTGTADPDGARDDVLHTIACKAAIKGGWQTSEEELLAVCRAVMNDEVRYCPHGRPVAIRLTKHDFEKQFGRSK